MQNIRSLDYDEASKAVAAGIEEAERCGLRMAFAVTDHAGDLINCVRMPGVPARVLRHAMRKAYTAAVMGRNTLTFGRNLSERGGNLDQWGDDRLTTLQGGLVAVEDGFVVGGVACGGAPLEDDESISRHMLQAIGLKPVEA